MPQFNITKMFYFKYILGKNHYLPWNRTNLSAFCSSKGLSTIYALSTGLNSAISVHIIRISGPQSYKVLQLLNRKEPLQNRSRQEILSKFNIRPKMMKLCNLYGRNDGIIDKGMVVFFERNHSYSGEDMFQLHLHGSKAVIAAIFQELSSLSFEIAKRGEFTRRAVMNNKMRVEQAEAIHDLISSELQFERQIAINNLLGKSKRFILELREELLKISALIQAYIQFQQEQVGNLLFDDAKKKVKKVKEDIGKITDGQGRNKDIDFGQAKCGQKYLDQLYYEEESGHCQCYPWNNQRSHRGSFYPKGLQDTLHRYSWPPLIFLLTIVLRNKALQVYLPQFIQSMQESNINLVILDIKSSQLIQNQGQIIIKPNKEEKQLLRLQNKMVIVNKVDSLSQKQKGKVIRVEGQNNIFIIVDLCLSFQQSEHTQLLLQGLGQRIQTSFQLFAEASSEIYFTRARYIEALKDCRENLDSFERSIYADMGSNFLKLAIKDISQIIGNIGSEQVLDSIFSSFCIGK